MAVKVEKWYPGEGKLTPGRTILYVILMLGIISAAGKRVGGPSAAGRPGASGGRPPFCRSRPGGMDWKVADRL